LESQEGRSLERITFRAVATFSPAAFMMFVSRRFFHANRAETTDCQVAGKPRLPGRCSLPFPSQSVPQAIASTMPPQTEALRFDVVTVTLNPAIDRTVTIHDFRPGTVNRVEAVRTWAGGKGINVAAGLADAGHRVAASGFIGDENRGIFEELFGHKGIHDACVRLQGSTRVSIKIVDPDKAETTDINFPGLPANPAALNSLEQRLSQIAAPWYVVAGSLPPGVPPTVYARLIRFLKDRGGEVVLDTSGEALRAAIAVGPSVIKPNVHELEELVGAPLTTTAALIEAARTLLMGGVTLVAISRGEQGAAFITNTEVVHARPPSIAVESTVGAGDAMVAGIVAAKLRGLTLRETARLATAFSLHALTRNDRSPPQAGELEALASRVALS